MQGDTALDDSRTGWEIDFDFDSCSCRECEAVGSEWRILLLFWLCLGLALMFLFRVGIHSGPALGSVLFLYA